MLLQYLGEMLLLLERERTHTRTTSTVFFNAFQTVCTIFVPSDYILRAIDHVHDSDETRRASTRAFAEQFVEERQLLGEAACVAAAKTNKVATRATCFAAVSDKVPMIDADLFLANLATFYEGLLDGRQRQMSRTFAKFDIDGDGHLSLGEFTKMLHEVHDFKAHPMSHAQIARLYHDAMQMGDGVIREADVQQLLWCADTMDHAQHMEPRNLEVAAAHQNGGHARELAELSRGWSEVRISHSTREDEPSSERMQHFRQCLHLVIRIQRSWKKVVGSGLRERHRRLSTTGLSGLLPAVDES